MTVYVKGTKVRLSWETRNSAGNLADPSADDMVVDIVDPAGNVTTYIYPTDTEITKDSTGSFHIDLVLDMVKEWLVRIESEDSLVASHNETIMVKGI